MTGIPARPRARWLPSRSRLAIFRLIGFLLSRKAPDQTPGTGILTIDRDQNAIENYSVALLTLITIPVYIAAALYPLVSLAAAIVIAIVVEPVAVQIPFYVTGLFVVPAWRRITGRRSDNNVHANTVAYMAVLLGASAYFAVGHRLVRPLAMAWLLLAVVNAIAAIVMWLLKHRVRELESRCVA